jgi:hypothetical protein
MVSSSSRIGFSGASPSSITEVLAADAQDAFGRKWPKGGRNGAYVHMNTARHYGQEKISPWLGREPPLDGLDGGIAMGFASTPVALEAAVRYPNA